VGRTHIALGYISNPISDISSQRTFILDFLKMSVHACMYACRVHVRSRPPPSLSTPILGQSSGGLTTTTSLFFFGRPTGRPSNPSTFRVLPVARLLPALVLHASKQVQVQRRLTAAQGMGMGQGFIEWSTSNATTVCSNFSSATNSPRGGDTNIHGVIGKAKVKKGLEVCDLWSSATACIHTHVDLCGR
jgi:hypothetical protein